MLSVTASVALVRHPASQSAATQPSQAGLLRSEKEVPGAMMRHVTAVWSRLIAWKMRRATRIILCSLEDRILNDIGLPRSEIDTVVRDVHARTWRLPITADIYHARK